MSSVAGQGVQTFDAIVVKEIRVEKFGLGIAGTAQGATLTQTYSTANATVANPIATNPSPPAGYTAHASGATAVTSNAATDLDTTAAALQALTGAVTAYEVQISNLVLDMASVKQNLNSVIDELQIKGILK